MTRLRRPLAGLALAGLAVSATLGPRVALDVPAGAGLGPDAGVRLLGPIANIAADFMWLRADAARRAGRHDMLFARAALALHLRPEATEGWAFLAQHQALYLGSPLRESNAVVRRRWLEAGLATVERGEQHAREPEQLALLAGVLLQTHAENDPETAWPNGTAGLWHDAAAAFRRAGELGYPSAGLLADAASALALRGAAD